MAGPKKKGTLRKTGPQRSPWYENCRGELAGKVGKVGLTKNSGGGEYRLSQKPIAILAVDQGHRKCRMANRYSARTRRENRQHRALGVTGKELEPLSGKKLGGANGWLCITPAN